MSTIRFPQDAQEIFACAEAARDQDLVEDAARLFGRSAAIWRAEGRVFQAIDAYFELGAMLLLQGRGTLLSDLAGRLLELLKHDPLPPGSQVKLHLFACLMERGAANQAAYFSLVHEQRRHRKARREYEEAKPEATAHREAPGESSSSWTPAPNERFLERRFAMETRRESIALAGRLEMAARALDCPIRCIIDETQVTAWIPATDAGWEMAWMLEAKDVALMEEFPV